MGYTSGAKTIYDIIDEICAALIASSGLLVRRRRNMDNYN